MLTQKYLKDILHYDPKTGIFTWKVDRGSNKVKGKEAGGLDNNGYRVIGINKKLYYAHRLSWLYMTGSWPINEIDHRDNNPDNNKWNNLRGANPSQNKMNAKKYKNNTSGFKGISYHKKNNKWVASIDKDRKRYFLGQFSTPEEAYKAYCQASKKLHKEFSNLK